jgi:hypothetical protein
MREKAKEGVGVWECGSDILIILPHFHTSTLSYSVFRLFVGFAIAALIA